MDTSGIKNKVLQSLIDAMEARSVDGLKAKSPKFAKVDIQSDDPKLAMSLKDKLIGNPEDDSQEEPSEEKSESLGDKLKELLDPSSESEENPEEDEDLRRMMESRYSKIK